MRGLLFLAAFCLPGFDYFVTSIAALDSYPAGTTFTGTGLTPVGTTVLHGTPGPAHLGPAKRASEMLRRWQNEPDRSRKRLGRGG